MNELKETIDNAPVRAFLVCADTGEYDAERSMQELKQLAETAGVDTVAQVIQKRPSYDSATCIGSGRLAELAEEAKAQDIELIIFDSELTANQTKNIEAVTDIRVIDRTTLILDIFAQRALTAEGRLQVEMAQQKYRLSHLAGKGVAMSRLGGGIGTRGPGETKLETDRRHIRSRITALGEQLAELEGRRGLRRSRRKKDNILTAAIVGYTNAGKSTLLNALTDSDVYAEDKLFATLDITSRQITLPDGRNLMLTDTVGFISRLPHNLVEAFKSTLEEAANADIIINVTDISCDDAKEQTRVTSQLLSELGCDGIPQIMVLNKCDKLTNTDDIPLDSKTVMISAKSRTGFDELLKCISDNLPAAGRRGFFLIPYDKTGIINTILIDGKVYTSEYLPEGTLIDAFVDNKIYHLVEPYRH
ncbi:MAG: GTPase HflX [Oscillospiraceae bacterium]|nr:GTPase HflX [Oscillospiraceae bacterium]